MGSIKRFPAILFIAFLVITPFSCKKAESPSEEAAAPASMSEPVMQAKSALDSAGAVEERKAEADGPPMKPDDGRGLQGHFLAPMDLAKERLLEYRVEMTYETKNILASRHALLAVVAKYGYVKSGSAVLDESTATAVSDVYVKSEKLYEALMELDKIGTLLAENITATDHTEDMALQNLKEKRERIRIARKGIASGQATAASRNWNDIENSLSQSEDGLDAAEHKKWQIRDKVAWACIHVELNGPEQPGRIKVPKYVNAFIGLLNVLLVVAYGLIYVVPFAALAGVIIWKRKEILGIFRRKKE
ncbi:MAG TPA: DUF4349 domain-containing protein [Spirochaetota bacterium]|nr:DUF4349 domain-containing protein [Spirochaetota bacterium]HOD13606.1 DUF4349 domain-containing protein [Spirochaetota bacterium]HPG51630.1 DUF4349 domain-containing protein [Spirochaetota bacterium]HPN12883.1 DUF4349 domain-containing protein [Spirochaetota bacterium]